MNENVRKSDFLNKNENRDTDLDYTKETTLNKVKNS